MDASKLRKLIEILIDDNEVVQTPLDAYLGLFAQLNQASLNQSQRNAIAIKIPNALNDLRDACIDSPADDLSESNRKILLHIGGTDFFGRALVSKITEIHAHGSYSIEIQKGAVEEFSNKRADFIASISRIDTEFENFNISSHANESQYEIGILFNRAEDALVPSINKNLRDWNLLLKALGEINGDNSETRISFSNNGSLEFFTEKSQEIALAFLYINKCIKLAFDKIQRINKALETLEKLKYGLDETKKKNEVQKEIIDQTVDEVTSVLLKSYGADGRVHELKVQLEKGTRFVARALDKGIEFEVTPPELVSPATAETEEGGGDQSKVALFNSMSEGVSAVKKLLHEIKEIGHDGKEIVGLLGLDASDDDAV